MKVLLGTPYPYINQKIQGGVETVSKNLKLGFERYEPNIIFKVVSSSRKAQKIYENYDGVTYIKQPRLKLGSIFVSHYPSRIKKFLKQNDFDVFNAHEIDFGYYGLDIKDKLLFTLHGIEWKEKKYMAKYKQPFYHFFYVKKLEEIIKNQKYLVSISPYVKEEIENKTDATIFEICNPVTDEFFEIKNKSHTKRMFYIGVISKRKNLLTLIKSLKLVRKEIKDFKLVIAGGIGDKDYFEEIITYIHKNSLENNIEYLGSINEEQKHEEFSKMSFLVLTSLQETSPVVISEAFAAGKPVMASNICGIPYMIDDGKNGFLVDPQNEKDIADKIIYLLENPDIAKSMGIDGKKYAKKYHSLRTVVKRYKNAYEEVVSKC